MTKSATPTDTLGRMRALLAPVEARLQTLGTADLVSRDEADRVLAAARSYGLTGMRYGLLAALAVVSPKDAIARLLGYVEAAERDEAAACEPDADEITEDPPA